MWLHNVNVRVRDWLFLLLATSGCHTLLVFKQEQIIKCLLMSVPPSPTPTPPLTHRKEVVIWLALSSAEKQSMLYKTGFLFIRE